MSSERDQWGRHKVRHVASSEDRVAAEAMLDFFEQRFPNFTFEVERGGGGGHLIMARISDEQQLQEMRLLGTGFRAGYAAGWWICREGIRE